MPSGTSLPPGPAESLELQGIVATARKWRQADVDHVHGRHGGRLGDERPTGRVPARELADHVELDHELGRRHGRALGRARRLRDDGAERREHAARPSSVPDGVDPHRFTPTHH